MASGDPTVLVVGGRVAALLDPAERTARRYGGTAGEDAPTAGTGVGEDVPGAEADFSGDSPQSGPLPDPFRVETAAHDDLSGALDGSVACVVCDGDDGGLATLQRVRARRPDLPTVLYTDGPDGELAAAATREGVTEYAVGSDLADREETLADRVAAVAERPDADSGPDPSERVDRVVERIDDGFFAVDDDWRFTYVNDRAREVLGLDRSLLGEPVAEVFADSGEGGFRTRFERAMETQEPVSFEEYHDPQEAWYEVSAHPDEDGLSVFFRDVTERRRRERILSRLLEFTRSLMAADTPGAVADRAVEAAEEILDFEMVTVRLHDPDSGTLPVVAASDATRALVDDLPVYSDDEGDVGRVFRTGEPEVFDDIRHRSDADYGAARGAITLPLGDHGVLGIGSTEPAVFDESDLHAAELLATTVAAALDRAERIQQLAEYETILETAREMLYVLDASERFEHVSERLAAILGHDPEDLVGEHVSTVVSAEEVRRGRDLVRDLRWSDDDAKVFRTNAVTAGGDRLPIEVEVTLLPDGDGEFRGTVGAVRDISDLRATEERLATQNERFEYLLEHIPDPVVETEFDEGEPIVRAANPAFEATFGYDADEVAGEPLNDLIVPPEEDETARRIDERTLEEETVTAEIRRDTVEGVRSFLLRAVSFTANGKRFGFGVYTDITEQKEHQRRLQVLQTVLRHNIRTDVTIIQGYAERMEDRYDDELLTEIREASVELARTSDKARDIEYALDEDAWDRGVRDVVPLVESAVSAARERFPGATVRTDLPGEARAVADGRVERVLAHVLENAVVHCDRDPRITVGIDPPTDRDGWLAIRVADNGPGIPEREQALITGEREITQLDHGSGLGLWVSAWIVRALGGELDFEAADPRGSVVVIRLPDEVGLPE